MFQSLRKDDDDSIFPPPRSSNADAEASHDRERVPTVIVLDDSPRSSIFGRKKKAPKKAPPPPLLLMEESDIAPPPPTTYSSNGVPRARVVDKADAAGTLKLQGEYKHVRLEGGGRVSWRVRNRIPLKCPSYASFSIDLSSERIEFTLHTRSIDSRYVDDGIQQGICQTDQMIRDRTEVTKSEMIVSVVGVGTGDCTGSYRIVKNERREASRTSTGGEGMPWGDSYGYDDECGPEDYDEEEEEEEEVPKSGLKMMSKNQKVAAGAVSSCPQEEEEEVFDDGIDDLQAKFEGFLDSERRRRNAASDTPPEIRRLCALAVGPDDDTYVTLLGFSAMPWVAISSPPTSKEAVQAYMVDPIPLGENQKTSRMIAREYEARQREKMPDRFEFERHCVPCVPSAPQSGGFF